MCVREREERERTTATIFSLFPIQPSHANQEREGERSKQQHSWLLLLTRKDVNFTLLAYSMFVCHIVLSLMCLSSFSWPNVSPKRYVRKGERNRWQHGSSDMARFRIPEQVLLEYGHIYFLLWHFYLFYRTT